MQKEQGWGGGGGGGDSVGGEEGEVGVGGGARAGPLMIE